MQISISLSLGSVALLAGAGVPPNALVSRSNNQPLVSRDNGAILTARAA